MIFGKSKLELNVGIFVFVGGIILLMFVFLIGNFRTWTSGYTVDFVFNFVNGVKVGAPVRFAGVDAGEVKRLTIYFDSKESKSKVSIQCWIKRDAKIPIDSTIWVNTLGLLGEKYIEIIPGVDYANCLSDHATLEGKDPIPMHEVTEMARGIVEKLDTTIAAINEGKGTIGKLFVDDAVHTELVGLVQEAEGLVKDLRRHPWKLLWKSKE